MHQYKKIRVGLAVLCVILVGLFYVRWHSGRTKDEVTVQTAVFGDLTTDGSRQPDPSGEIGEETAAQLCVYVCGAVANPGIYYLEEGARIAQALEAAGGMLPDADLSAINPAMQAADSQKIYVPTIAERAAGSFGTEIPGGVSENGLININTADAALLSTLPGIGKVKAESIVAYREANGGFQTVEDIKNVSGIKDSSYDKIKELICI